jgi:hypothetical protein
MAKENRGSIWRNDALMAGINNQYQWRNVNQSVMQY